MRYKGQDYEVFGNGASGKLNFPGDVTADIDSKGRLIEVQRPGLALKELTYSDDDQLDQLFFGGQLLRDYDYRNGDLSEVRVVNANGPEDLYAYQYDEHGRLSTILENGAVLAAWTYPDPNNSAGQDPDQRFVDGERVLSYTDGNGVLHRYGYDAYGYTNRIDIEGGPTFHYRRDDAGNLLELQSSGMAVTYTDWQEGLPATMTWGDGTRFSIDRDSNNNLQRIADDAEVFVLDLTWRPETASGDPCESGGTEDKQLTRIERKAGSFSEIIEPAYNSDEHLTGVTINRNSNGVTDQIQESYGTVQNQLLGGLTRLLNNQILVDAQLAAEAGADNRRIHQRIGATGATEPSGTDQYSYDPVLGNLQQINRRDGTVRTFVWDGFRRLREIRDDNSLTAQYHYDHQYRRIRAATQHHPQPLAFAYEGSKVIAIGLYEGPGQVQWTHAIGQGPLGPAFIKDLTGAGMDYHIFTDHLGTPLAYKNTNTGTVYINPRSPWGESLANTPTRGSPYTTQNFTLPPDPIFPTTPLGLSGHLEDADTGLIYMHHRFYDPALGHFLNPDFRAPDIYDPSTFTEPYAFAAGNPIMFWDPNGLSVHEYLNDAFSGQLFALGLVYGLTKETLLGFKDLFILGARVHLANFRIELNDSMLFLGYTPLAGVEDDKAYIKLVNSSLRDLFVHKGIFHQIGEDAGNSLAISNMLSMQGRHFESGVASTKFVEAISLLASLPKVGLAVSRHSGGAVARSADDFALMLRQSDVSANPRIALELENGRSAVRFDILRQEGPIRGGEPVNPKLLHDLQNRPGPNNKHGNKSWKSVKVYEMTKKDIKDDLWDEGDTVNADWISYSHTIRVRKDVRNIELIEEWLHSVQERDLYFREAIGERPPSFTPYPREEVHVKDFMIRHRRILGISDEDAERLRLLLVAQLKAKNDINGVPLTAPRSASNPIGK
ncbi:RHS repeat domain-containing protein [Acanthopleuribacter pedis]|uniref:RHS repeat-associated core domain-containing protein n=1 Tax=Acanthopleuribacter pedis TaxID=442870 RepID=A0A8J7U6C9_9BACT|nr:RHS repeat-associated core domain-containing protein [Acanthopleuribacter pedis]MBO1323493.1 RHS repeat-associated core domain-containing protein [Acanthopleuribacter pedis]